MPIKLTRKPFGEFTLHTIGNEESYISFVPERSAYIHQIRLSGIDILDNYVSGVDLKGNSGYKNLALLPFPNRLFEGKYEWAGRLYEMEVNDNNNRSALHGFGPTVPFVVERFAVSTSQASVKLTYLHRPQEHPDSYPFLIRFELTLGIDVKANTASWNLSATNLGKQSAPVGLGWHPYFLLPGGHEKWSLEMPANEQVVLAKAMPTHERRPGPRATSIDINWDDCFALSDPEDLEIKLLGPLYSLSLKQLESTRYTQIYVPGDKKSIAIEPMTCGVNAFNVSKGEVQLSPKQILKTGLVIGLRHSS